MIISKIRIKNAHHINHSIWGLYLKSCTINRFRCPQKVSIVREIAIQDQNTENRVEGPEFLYCQFLFVM